MRVLLPILGLLALGCAGSTPLATFTVVGSEADESCSKLTDYCVRVTCTLKNDGMVPGQAVVDAQLLDPEGKVLHTQSLRAELGPGDTRTLTHDFTEAKLLGNGAEARCVVR